MRSKLNFLINMSLKKKIKSKWFLIANIIVLILMVAIINIDSIITLFGGDFDEKTKIYVKDETNYIYDGFKENLNYIETNLYSEENKYDVIKEERSIDELKNLIQEEENSALIVQIYFDENNNIKSNLISLTTIDIYDYQIISSALTSTYNIYALNSIDLTEEEYNKITKGIEIERVILDENMTDEDEDTEMIMTTVFPVIILPFFMLILLLVQFIGSEINDEKSTRSMEIIISNVSPAKHFASKIIANNLFIIIQVILIALYVIFGLFLRKIIGGDTIVNGVMGEISSMFSVITSNVMTDKFIIVLIATIILMLLTFIAYSLVAGILASITTNTEDYQQVQVPILIVLLLGYYLSMMAGMFKGSLFIKIFAFIPFISSILAPSLLVLGQIGLIQVIISIIIMIITVYLLVKYGLRIYKVGILNYSQTGLWKKIFKSVRNK